MIQEFVCPNGRMSVNGVCPIFEGDDGQIKDIKNKKTSTYDALKEDEIFEEDKGFFEFDFEKPTESAFESADNIIKTNINAYQNFVSDKLGISPKVQTFGTFLSMARGLASGGGALAVLGPLIVPTIGGNPLRKAEIKRIQDITDRDTQGTINTVPTAILKNKPTARDINMGGGNIPSKAPSSTKTFSAPQQTSGLGGLHNYG